MRTEERNRLVKAYYNPELNAVGCVAKCAAGVAIVALVAAIGVTSEKTEGGHPGAAARVRTAQSHLQGSPQHEAATQELQANAHRGEGRP